MPKVKIVKNIKRKGFPTDSKYYREAHSEALNAEKKKFPKTYQKLKKISAKMPSNELMGTNKKNGTIEVSSSVRQKGGKRVKLNKTEIKETGFHEGKEHKVINRLSKGNK